MLEVLENQTEENLLILLKSHCRALSAQIKKLGKDPNEDKLIPVLENFCANITEIAKENDNFGPIESRGIREWFSEYAEIKELCITDLDDLDYSPVW